MREESKWRSPKERDWLCHVVSHRREGELWSDCGLAEMLWEATQRAFDSPWFLGARS